MSTEGFRHNIPCLCKPLGGYTDTKFVLFVTQILVPQRATTPLLRSTSSGWESSASSQYCLNTITTTLGAGTSSQPWAKGGPHPLTPESYGLGPTTVPGTITSGVVARTLEVAHAPGGWLACLTSEGCLLAIRDTGGGQPWQKASRASGR